MKTRLRRIGLLVAWLLPLSAPATEHSGNGWVIRKESKETYAESGGIIYYTIYVERTGADAGSVVIMDVRDSSGTTEYDWISPSPDDGGGTAEFAAWNRTMNQGDTFSVLYGVYAGSGLAAGTPIKNFVMVDTDPYDPDVHISVDHFLVVGGGNQTRTANRGCGQANEPVSTGTGEFFLPPVTDLDLGGPLPLRFTRWYGSRLNDPGMDLIGSALGVGWMHGFESRAIHSGFFERTLRVILPGGKIASLTEVYGGDGGWALSYEQEDVAYEGKEDGQSFWLMDPESERLYRFDAPPSAWGSTNRLREILDRNGNSLLLEHRADGRVTNVADGLGRSLSFTYTAAGHLLAVGDGTRTIGFGCDAQGTVVSVTNALGQVVTYGYDPVNSHANGQGALMTAVEHPRGNIPYAQTYHTNGQVVSQASATGGTSTFAYTTTAYGETTQIDDPDGTLVHNHLSYARATNLADQAGNGIGIAYQTPRNLPTSIRDRRGHETVFRYDRASRRLTNVVHRDGTTTTYSYVTTTQVFTNRETGTNTVSFDFQDLSAIRHPDGSTEEFHRDARGNVTGYVDRAGAVWATTYNGRGQPLTVVRPGGGVQTFAYNPDGMLGSATDSDTGVTTYAYDALRRRIRTTRPDGGVTAMAYDAGDRIAAITNAAGGTAHFQHDPNNLRTNATDPAGYAINRQYDQMNRITNRSDSLGPLLAVEYDRMSRPVTETDPAGTNHYFYDARGWITNQTRAGRSWSWTYDPEGNVAEILSPLGNRTIYHRDPMGRLTNAVGPLMEFRTMAYDGMGRRVQVTDPNANTTRFAYDGAGRLAAVTNALGAAAFTEYNPEGLVARATDFDGNAVSFGYTPMGRLESITNALGEVTSYTYDTAGRLAAIDFPDGTRETRTHDAAGRVRTRTDRGTNTWSYGYDLRGDVVAATNPAGGVTVYTYRLDGLPETVADTDGGPVSNRYDAARRLVETVLADGASVQYEYNAHGEVTAYTDANGNRTEYACDAEGRVLSETDADGHVLHFAYDASGRITNLTDRAGAAHRFEYDAGGRRTAVVDATGLRIEYGFNALDRMTSVTRGGRTWTRAYDNSGRLTAHSTPMGRTTTFLLDAAGRSAGQVDPMGRTNAVARDAMGRITAIIDPAGRERTFAYDARGLLISAGGTGQAPARYERDALGNVTRITDPNTNDWTFAYSPMGARTGQTDPLGRTLSLARNARGQIIEATHPDAVLQTLHYDSSGNLTGTVYSTGLTLGYAYDVHNRLAAADGVALERDSEGRITNTVSTADGRAFGAAYDVAGRLTAVTYDGVMTVNYGYNPTNGLLETVSDTLSGASVNYAYDADGRVTGLTRGNGQHATYTYDPASRTTRIQDGTLLDVQFEYDAAGRLTAEEGTRPLDVADGLADEAAPFAYDAAAQVASPGFAYDPLGRCTAAPGHAYAWDAASRLVEADGALLAYDGLDEVVTRTEGGITNRYYTNRALIPASIVSERNETAGEYVRHYVWSPGGLLLYAVEVAAGHQPRYYHFDRNGSTLALTDGNGYLTDAYAYTPFGRMVRRQGTSTQPFTFVGQYGIRQQDAAGTLYQMRARYYDAQAGRFLSPDPAGPDPAHPRKLNPYSYVGNQPLGRIDRDGLDWWGPSRDPLPPDADLAILPDCELDRIEALLNAENRDDSINMPEACKRLDRIRVERMRRSNPGGALAPPDPAAPEHTSCEQQALNEAGKAGGVIQADPGSTPGRSYFPQRPGDILADAMAWEFRRLMEQKMAADLLREKERTMYNPQVFRDGRWQPVVRPGVEEPVAPSKKRFEIKEEWMRAPPPPPPNDFPDPLADILNELFGPEALMNFVKQQEAAQRAQQQAELDASKPAPAPPKPRIPTSELFKNQNAAQRKAADLMQAGDFQGAREALDEARQWENEIDERRNREGFTMFFD